MADVAAFTACKRMDDSAHVFPGWLCCRCRVYNGYQREACKRCGHAACYPFRPLEFLPYITGQGEMAFLCAGLDIRHSGNSDPHSNG